MDPLAAKQLALVFINIFVDVFYVLLLIRLILSWFASGTNSFYGWLVGVTEPVLAPIRKMVPSAGGLDLAPLVAFILLQLLQAVARSVLE
ncbi:YggT family protein [bacterium]|nr:MAG: YggT family protein [bacterium]